MKKYWCIFFTVIFLSCSQKKKLCFAYNTNLYISNGTALERETTPYILYDKWLIEFFCEYNYISKVDVNKNIQSDTIVIDTTGCRLIMPDRNLYFEIDSFYSDFKILKRGVISKMDGGLTLRNDSLTNEIVFQAPLRDTVINNMLYQYMDSVVTQQKGGFSEFFLVKYFFCENPRLITIFSINGMKHKNTNICFVGYDIQSLSNGSRQMLLVEDVTSVSDKTKELCKKIFDRLSPMMDGK